MSRISFPFVDHVLVCLFNLLLTLIEQLEDLIINTNNSFLTLAKEAMYFLKETERGGKCYHCCLSEWGFWE